MSAATLALLDEVRACTLCSKDLPLPPRPILQWHPSARVLIAGQAPGRKTHAAGLPFDDVSGDRLRVWLGLSREQFYTAAQIAIVPMGFCFPGTGRAGDLPPRPECAATWRTPLLAGLAHVRLTLVLGQYAHAWHLPHAPASVTHAVSAWRDAPGDVVPLPHPSPRNNLWLRRNPWFETDMVPAVRARVAAALLGP
jgi:uracil-DNA glycosylase